MSDTDEESEVCGWLTCKSRHILPQYGDPAVLIGRTFTVMERYKGKATFASKCPHGKVHSVVRQPVVDEESTEGAEVYFKIYDHTKHRRKAPSPESEGI